MHSSYDKIDPNNDELPWAEKGEESYDKACEACELWVRVPDVKTRDLIWASLFYDKRTSVASFRGLAMRENLQLQDGTLLERGTLFV